MQTDNLGLLDELVTKVQAQDDGDIDVTGDEGLGGPVALGESRPTAGEEEEEEEAERGPGDVGLEGGLPGEFVTGDALGLAAVVEAEVDDADDGPGDEGTDRDEILEPDEDDVGAGTEGHEAEADPDGDEGDGDPRYTHAVGLEEDLGGVVLLGHTVEGTGGGEQEGVTGGPGRGQDDKVDDVGDHLDTGTAGCDDEGGGGGGTAALEQVGIIGGHEHADEEDTEDYIFMKKRKREHFVSHLCLVYLIDSSVLLTIEDCHTPEDTLSSNGDVSARALCLGGSHGDILNTTIFFVRKSNVPK